MARQMGPPSLLCHCPVCLSALGIATVRKALLDASYANGKLCDVLEPHFRGQDAARIVAAGVYVLDGIAMAGRGIDRMEQRLFKLTSGHCETSGVRITTLRAPDLTDRTS